MQKICFGLFLVMLLPVNVWAAVQVPTKEYVEERIETTVSIAGNQQISGQKEYTQSPKVPTPALP